ncbi:hypothetical protein [Devosia sp.]|uniref:hypothetical protein n=1 Tax=Devosia sp. TaxID=1871048 RepID=UPI002733EE3D|nr:hypothetical protein [Devosia sp.]MDP2779771.1 hypothetical protein [Devosia sp.]
MKVRVTIQNGRINIAVEEGTLEEGAVKIREIERILQAQGITLADEGEVEQHRHDDAHVYTGVQA